jgi:hypothetical protein
VKAGQTDRASHNSGAREGRFFANNNVMCGWVAYAGTPGNRAAGERSLNKKVAITGSPPSMQGPTGDRSAEWLVREASRLWDGA